MLYIRNKAFCFFISSLTTLLQARQINYGFNLYRIQLIPSQRHCGSRFRVPLERLAILARALEVCNGSKAGKVGHRV